MNTKKRLGKGLSALIGDDFSIESSKAEIQSSVSEIPIDKLFPNPKQPRSVFEEEKLNELAESIKSVGIIEPVVVQKSEDKYQIIAGERRWRAAQIAEIKTIPVVIKEDAEIKDNILEMMLIENIQREDLTPIEEAESYQLLIREKEFTQDKIAGIIGKSRSHISNTIRLLSLPKYIRDYVNQKKLNMGHAKVLVNLDKESQNRIVEQIINNNLSVREVEKKVQENNVSRETLPKQKKVNKNTYITSLEDKLRDKFKTKVSINSKKENHGKIEIEYYSLEDLNGILNSFGISLD
jgi:ParB family chromosome partitioning protein